MVSPTLRSEPAQNRGTKEELKNNELNGHCERASHPRDCHGGRKDCPCDTGESEMQWARARRLGFESWLCHFLLVCYSRHTTYPVCASVSSSVRKGDDRMYQ